MLGVPGLGPFLGDLHVVTGPCDFSPGTAFLVRPDGQLAARGRPGAMEAVTGYLRDLFPPPEPGSAACRRTRGHGVMESRASRLGT
jgi:hypothetical protein